LRNRASLQELASATAAAATVHTRYALFAYASFDGEQMALAGIILPLASI